MKVIDLKDRTLFVDDIIQLYIEEKYSPERYNIQTTNGIYLVYKEDYFKVKDYLLSLNDEVKEDLKIYELENQLQQKENKEKELREYIESFKKIYEGYYPYIDTRYLDLNKLLEILGSDKE